LPERYAPPRHDHGRANGPITAVLYEVEARLGEEVAGQPEDKVLVYRSGQVTTGIGNWLLDPRTRSLEAYLLGEQGYQLAGVYGPGTIFRPALFPGLEIPVDSLWEG